MSDKEIIEHLLAACKNALECLCDILVDGTEDDIAALEEAIGHAEKEIAQKPA